MSFFSTHEREGERGKSPIFQTGSPIRIRVVFAAALFFFIVFFLIPMNRIWTLRRTGVPTYGDVSGIGRSTPAVYGPDWTSWIPHLYVLYYNEEGRRFSGRLNEFCVTNYANQRVRLYVDPSNPNNFTLGRMHLFAWFYLALVFALLLSGTYDLIIYYKRKREAHDNYLLEQYYAANSGNENKNLH